jgi:ATP-dependent DNA helicase RecG
MPIVDVIPVTEQEAQKILAIPEGHFCDLKAIEIKPAKLTRSLLAFANAEGGELFIGIDEVRTTNTRSWRGFARPEDANGFIQAFEGLFPLGENYSYSFLNCSGMSGYVLKVEVRKTRDIKEASDGGVYVRRRAQNLPVGVDDLARLRRNKGIVSFENEPISAIPRSSV